jgi:hypothetical protein
MSLKGEMKKWYREDMPAPPPRVRSSVEEFWTAYWYIPAALLLFSSLAIASCTSTWRFISLADFNPGVLYPGDVKLYYAVFTISALSCFALLLHLYAVGFRRSPFIRFLLGNLSLNFLIGIMWNVILEDMSGALFSDPTVRLYASFGIPAAVFALQILWLLTNLVVPSLRKKKMDSTLKIVSIALYAALLSVAVCYLVFIIELTLEIENTLRNIGPINFMPRC